MQNTLTTIEKIIEHTDDKNTHRLLVNVCNIFWYTIPKAWPSNKKELYDILVWISKDNDIFTQKDWYLILWSHSIVNHDTKIEPWVILAWNVTINHSTRPSTIWAWSFLKDCSIIDSDIWQSVIIEWWQYSKIINSSIWDNTVLFWWAKIRDSKIWQENEIWFWEFVRTTTWKLMKALHISYLWDTEVWDNVNIANWFGVVNSWPDGTKSKTILWNDVFTGGGSRIVPWKKWVTVGNGAIIAAWVTVICDIPENHTYISKDRIYPNKEKLS